MAVVTFVLQQHFPFKLLTNPMNPSREDLMLRTCPQITPGTDQERPYRGRGDP